MYFLVPHTSGNGPAKSNSISWLGFSTVGSFPRVLWFERGFKFLPALTHSIQLSPWTWISRYIFGHQMYWVARLFIATGLDGLRVIGGALSISSMPG